MVPGFPVILMLVLTVASGEHEDAPEAEECEDEDGSDEESVRRHGRDRSYEAEVAEWPAHSLSVTVTHQREPHARDQMDAVVPAGTYAAAAKHRRGVQEVGQVVEHAAHHLSKPGPGTSPAAGRTGHTRRQ